MNPLACEDCGHLYGNPDWLDTFLSSEQWKLISGHNDGGGILCAGCIVKRAKHLGLFSVCKMVFI